MGFSWAIVKSYHLACLLTTHYLVWRLRVRQVGEGILLGAIVIIGGLVARYMQTHPFYKFKTQKYKEQYQIKLHDVLRHKFDENQAYWISRALADHLFDFGRRLYVDHHIETHEKFIPGEKMYLQEYRLETPENLCEQLVLRAVELKIPILRFQNHAKELSGLYLIPVGQLMPSVVKRIAGGDPYVTELEQMRLTQAQMAIFLAKNS